MKNTKVLLYSGGTDSWLIDKLWKPDVKLYIDIDGMYSQREMKNLPADVIVTKFPLGCYEDKETAYIPMRNLYFLMIASNYGNHICFGATAGDSGAKDKTYDFIVKSQKMLNYLVNGNSTGISRQIVIEDRFVKLNKYQIMQQYLDEGGSLADFVNQTFSCHHPVGELQTECWHCKPCYKKFLLAKYFGYTFPYTIELAMLEFLKQNVIPRKALKDMQGTYFTERAGEGPYAEKAVEKFFKAHNLNWKDYQ